MDHATKSVMAREIGEIPDVLIRQVNEGLSRYLSAGRQLAASNPRGFVTCARGTSDHAATFFKYLWKSGRVCRSRRSVRRWPSVYGSG